MTKHPVVAYGAMQLKRIGIAALVAGATLVAASALVATGALAADDRPCAGARAEVFSASVHEASADAGTAGTGRFDPYTQGHRTGCFDPYTEGMGHPVVDLVWLQRDA